MPGFAFFVYSTDSEYIAGRVVQFLARREFNVAVVKSDEGEFQIFAVTDGEAPPDLLMRDLNKQAHGIAWAIRHQDDLTIDLTEKTKDQKALEEFTTLTTKENVVIN